MIPRPAQRGFYFIAILIVVAIILILTGKNLPVGPTTGTSATGSIDRAKDAKCAADRQKLKADIDMWQVSNGGEIGTIEQLQGVGIEIPQCGVEGVYSIGEDGTVHCSEHAAAPSNQ